MAAFPTSYQDPTYSSLASIVEQTYGLPTGILDAIRMRGERSNANQVSSAGARTPYQFIPSTRNAFIEKYNVDPWADPQQATTAAAIHLSQDYKRTGSWDKAIAMYYGGQHPGTAAQRYAARVGDFDTPDTSKPYYAGGPDMASSLYPVVNGVDPLAPEAPVVPVPVQGSAAPSMNVPAASPVASKKRGGILGALESVFMPDPSSLWAGALRDGVFNARESQQAYKEDQAAKLLNLATANAKLKQLQQHGEYQVVGNNVFHVKPDGTSEMISGPSSTDDKVKLIDKWRTMSDADPAKKLIEALIVGAPNLPETIAAKNVEAERIARIRAGATTGAATIRSNATNRPMPPLPPGFKVVK